MLRRILACLLVGNTDAHFKNFAMFHARDGLRLTPAYDLVAACLYPEYQSVALSVAGARNLSIGSLQARHLLRMAQGFGVTENALVSAVEQLGKRLPMALAALDKSVIGPTALRRSLQERLEKRWNGSFASIGQRLSKKRSKGGNAKS